MIRTFLAFELPNEIKNQVIEFKDSLKNFSYHKIKWVEDENLHITLQFIGDIKESDAKDLSKNFGAIFADLPPFEFSFSKLELVPGREPRIIWLKFETESKEIYKKHKKIKSYLYEKGYKIDKKPLKFHLTLGRIKRELDFYEIESFLKQSLSVENFLIDDITFFKSFLTPKGPIYTPLENYILKKIKEQ